MMPRHKQLQQAREQIIRVGKYINFLRRSGQISVEEQMQSHTVLFNALHEVREEIKHPDRFNLDGSRRRSNIDDSRILINMRRISAESSIA